MTFIKLPFCLHRWTPWSELVSTYNGTMQYRSCEKCNKVAKRKAFSSNDTNLSLWNTPTDSKEVIQAGDK